MDLPWNCNWSVNSEFDHIFLGWTSVIGRSLFCSDVWDWGLVCLTEYAANSMFNCEHGHRGPLSLCCSSANPDKLILYGESKEICYTRRFCEHDSFPEAHSNNILLIGDNLYVKGWLKRLGEDVESECIWNFH